MKKTEIGKIVETEKYLLYKTPTYMNLSGDGLAPLTKLFGKDAVRENLLVVVDNLEAKVGKVRIKNGGSHQGQNGVRSIIEHFDGNKDFKRLQFGVSRPESRDPQIIARYVETKFTKREEEILYSEAFIQGEKLMKGFCENL